MAVTMAAVLFAACGGGGSKAVETTTTTASAEEVCADILQNIIATNEKAVDALMAELEAITESEEQKQRNLKDLYMLEAEELDRELKAERCPNHAVGTP